MVSELKTASMSGQKVKAYVKLIQENENIWNAVLVFLGALFILSAIPFFPLYLVPILALICAVPAYKQQAHFGTLLSIIFAFFAIVYQSPALGWVFLLVLAITLFEMFKHWGVISALEILIFAPFAVPPLSYLGGFVMLGMVIATLHFGSKKSIFISIPAVLMILLLSSLWLTPNNAFLPLHLELYEPAAQAAQFAKIEAFIGNVPFEIGRSFGNFFSLESIAGLNVLMGKVTDNLLKILFMDTGFLQMLTWAIVLYLISFVSGRIKTKPQLVSSLILFLIPLTYYGFVSIGIPFNWEIIIYVIGTVLIVGGLEHLKISFSKEGEIGVKDRAKKFGKFGFEDLSFSKGEKSLDDVGNYEDVKMELRDSILMPLEKKEIAYTYGLKPPSGILLFGPPGTGKTMLMRAFSKEIKYGFYYVKSSDILSQWYGESLPYNEELLIRENGKIKREKIGKIVEDKINADVLSFDKDGKVRFSRIKNHIKHKCTSPIYEVRTRTGRKIKVTDYHSLFTLDGCKIKDVPTSELKAGISYIAIPNKAEFAEEPIKEIDILERLKENDYGFYVKNIEGLVRKSLDKIGEKEFRKIIGIGKRKKLSEVITNEMKMRASIFLNLINEADLNYKGKNVLVCSRKKSLPAIITIDEDLATFLGLWVAEGSYNYKHTVRISTSEGEIEKISELCRKLFGDVTIYSKGKGKDIYICSKLFYFLMHDIFGLEQGGRKKKMPEIAYSLSRKNLAALLRGYFSGDGSIYKNQRKVAMIEGSTASEKLTNDIMYLLLYFGIVASVYDKKEKMGNIAKRICFNGYELLNKFKEIGFLDNRRMSKLEEYLEGYTWARSEQIPLTGELKTKISGIAPKWNYSNTIGKDKLFEMDWAEEPEFFESIRNDIYLDRVEEIKRIEDEEYVYDVSVDPCQNFVGGFGGIFAHNSEKNIAELFETARKQSPCILFFDEIDALAKKRSDFSVDDVGPRVLSTILQEMDGFTRGKPVLVVGATNVPNKLDDAILRPGRFDKIIYMHLPDFEGRISIFKVHLSKMPIEDIDYRVLAQKSERFSGADIKNAVDEAIGIAAKEATKSGNIVPITMKPLLRVLKVLKPSTSLSRIDLYEQFRLDFERRVGGAIEEKKKEGEVIEWKDVGGLEDIKSALLEAIELPLLHEDLIKDYKIKPNKGILLFGPPGTGKTLIVKAASQELKASFITVSGAELMKRGYSQAVQVLRESFNRARENRPAIIFIDEIETIAPSRDISPSDIVGQLLTEMDGMKSVGGVVVIGATNKPSILDAAILRPGRFDKIFYVPPPDKKTREKIFEIHLERFAKGLDLGELAEMTEDFTGADIASIAQEAKMRMLRSKLAGNEIKLDNREMIDIITRRRPSVSDALIREYMKFLEIYGERR